LSRFQVPTALIIIWVIETAPFKLGYNRKYLGKLEEFHSDLHILYIFGKLQ